MGNAMHIVTDMDRIKQVHAENAPREPMMAEEMYPDATIDAQGRAHAPHDGYSTDGVTSFNGGEYLPEDPEAGRHESVWRIALYDASKHDGCDTSLGAVFGMEGSPAQIKAVRAEARSQERDFDRKAGISLPEGRADARLMIVSCWPKRDFHTDMPDQFGRMDFILRDEDLRTVRYTGTKLLARIVRHFKGIPQDLPDIGRWIDLKASFTHYTSKKTGNVSVIMKRPSGVKRLTMLHERREYECEHMPDDSVRHATCAEIAAEREWRERVEAEEERRRAA